MYPRVTSVAIKKSGAQQLRLVSFACAHPKRHLLETHVYAMQSEFYMNSRSVPLVSVLIPTLNSSNTLEKALQALRAQTLSQESLEIIVADGGSTDDTRTIAKAFGCTIVENTRVLPEYGLSVAMTHARGRFGVFLGSDEVILRPDAFETKIRVFEAHSDINSVMTAGLLNPKGYPSISGYVNCCGDPFSYFMHRIDGCNTLFSLRQHYRVIEDHDECAIVRIQPDEPFPICDGGGHFFRLELLRTMVDVGDHTIIPRLFVLLASKTRTFAVVKGDFIDHYSTSSFASAKAKIRWRIVSNIYHAESGSVGYSGRETDQPKTFQRKKYLFVPYAFSTVLPLVDAVRLAIRYKNPSMLSHLPLTIYTASTICSHLLLKKIGHTRQQTVYGK